MKGLERLWYGNPGLVTKAVATVALGPPSLVMGAIAQVRSALFSAGLLATHRVEGLRVISVGNLVAGGSGKTPLTIYLARWALAAGHRVAVLSRGYGRTQSAPVDFDASSLPDVAACGDEPRLIAQRAPSARVFVDADRVAAARRARQQGFDVAILDDGFQHRRLARDVDVVVEVPGTWGVLPLGPQREFGWARARAHVLFNGSRPHDPRGTIAASHALGPDGARRSIRGVSVVLLSGIARPHRFADTVNHLGAQVCAVHAFGDHHVFSAAELERVTADARRHAALVLTTEKDAQRLPKAFEASVLSTDLRVTANLDTLATALGWPAACAPVPTMEEGAA